MRRHDRYSHGPPPNTARAYARHDAIALATLSNFPIPCRAVIAGVVIPAHDEERTIARLLRELGPLEADVQLIVVCNGCRDRTATIAAEAAPWSTVVELAEGSKPAALRAGDARLTTTPRLYLDADVLLSADGV